VAIPAQGGGMGGVGGQAAAKRGAVGRRPGRPPSLAGINLLSIGIVTHMVKLRKLTLELINCLPDPSGEPVLQTKGLPINESISRPFFSSKIVQKSCKSLQKRAKNDRKNGFFQPGFSKACQAPRRLSRVIGRSRTKLEARSEPRNASILS
jgi:hypothetical protein